MRVLADIPMPETAARSEWRAGGSVLAVAMICYALSVFPVNILGPLITPLEEAFGWSRAVISSAILIAAAGTILFGPLAGYVVDRIGPRRMALIFVPAFGVATGLIGLAGPSVWTWFAAWALFTTLQTCGGIVIWSKAVVTHFDRHRGMALALMLSGAALAHGLLPGFAVLIMSIWDWRAVYFTLAAMVLGIGWPLTLWYAWTSRDPAVTAEEAVTQSADKMAIVRAALRNRQFWQMGIAFFVVAASVAALYVHFVPILTGAGYSAQRAASVVLILGPAAIVGRLGAGFLLDRFRATHVIALVMIQPAVCYLLLSFGGTSVTVTVISATLLGLVLGAEADFMAYLVSRYFGQQAFGTLYGVILGLFAVGYGTGPVISGWMFDASGAYEPVFVLFIIASLCGALLVYKLGTPAPSAGAEAV